MLKITLNRSGVSAPSNFLARPPTVRQTMTAKEPPPWAPISAERYIRGLGHDERFREHRGPGAPLAESGEEGDIWIDGGQRELYVRGSDGVWKKESKFDGKSVPHPHHGNKCYLWFNPNTEFIGWFSSKSRRNLCSRAGMTGSESLSAWEAIDTAIGVPLPDCEDKKETKKLSEARNSKKHIKKDLAQGSHNSQAGMQASSRNQLEPEGPVASSSGTNHPELPESGSPQCLPGDPEGSGLISEGVDPLKLWNTLGQQCTVHFLIPPTYIDTLNSKACPNQWVQPLSASYPLTFSFKVGLG